MVKESDLINRISDLAIKNSTLEENLHQIYEKINGIYEHMNTLTADDWKTEEKWEEYKLMLESMHHIASQVK